MTFTFTLLEIMKFLPRIYVIITKLSTQICKVYLCAVGDAYRTIYPYCSLLTMSGHERYLMLKPVQVSTFSPNTKEFSLVEMWTAEKRMQFCDLYLFDKKLAMFTEIVIRVSKKLGSISVF